MPAESGRLRHRMRKRDRLFLALAAAGLLAALVAALLLSHNRGGVGSNADCVVYSHPNFTGGATYRYCGAKAVPFCLHSAAKQEGTVAQCRRLGLPTRP